MQKVKTLGAPEWQNSQESMAFYIFLTDYIRIRFVKKKVFKGRRALCFLITGPLRPVHTSQTELKDAVFCQQNLFKREF